MLICEEIVSEAVKKYDKKYNIYLLIIVKQRYKDGQIVTNRVKYKYL